MGVSRYRPELDGLRAIAVLAVIIFHAGVDDLAGGFIGVDIFFVISGYLITTIIIGALEKNSFSLSTFYIRRVKRLLPAALVMVLLTVILGFFFLTPDNYTKLSNSAIFSNLFMANIWFMNNSGYFDQPTQISPLVHMWSLSVEEQFYLIFPVLLLFTYRYFNFKGTKYLVFLITGVSLALCILLSPININFSFYMLPARAWELGMGASLALLPLKHIENRMIANLLSYLGLLLITFSLFYLDHNDIYPGHLALLPTIGTALIIFTLINNDNFIKYILSSRPFRLVGKISYSAYLWHWPIVVYYRVYVSQREFFLHEVVLLVLASIGVGYLSWRYIEERYRYKDYSYKKVVLASSFSTLLLVGLSGMVSISQGFPGRISPAVAAITDTNLMWDFKCTERIAILDGINEEYCVVGLPWADAENKALIWGDSHSLHWAPLLHREALRNRASMVIAPTKCPPYLDSRYVKSNYPKFPKFTEDCTKRNIATLRWLQNTVDVNVVIMAAAWSGHVRMLYSDDIPFDNLDRQKINNPTEIGAHLSEYALKALLSKIQNKKTLILGDVPRPNRVLNECASASEMSALLRGTCEPSRFEYLVASDVHSWHKDSDAVLKLLSAQFKNTQVIIPSEFLCDSKYCKTYINKELIYKDNNHIRRNLEVKTVDMMSEALGIRDALRNIWEVNSG
ncbi:acyltransferase [Pseudomaricurvus alcaniphilus]|uniref:acyltransferase family protein n=1 Tax=Pseudomaricurvus alcaniphilus TaxID=1166482 RepID=UPI00140A7CBF|nr:acyltransferase family protein [Pseudomaricurvus alcaniphilus]NHN36725.1 acyltransferase [Pseudomaricurvus alcaniphilus]